MTDVHMLMHRIKDVVWNHLSGENGITILLLWTTVVFAAVVTYVRANPGDRSFRDFIRHFVPSEIFHNSSARADFLFWLSRRIFMPLVVLPLVISTIAAGRFAYWVLTGISGWSGRSSDARRVYHHNAARIRFVILSVPPDAASISYPLGTA